MDFVPTEIVLKELLTSISDTSETSSSHSGSSIIFLFDDDDLPRKRLVRIKDYVEVVHRYSEYEFKLHFRISLTTTQRIISLLENSIYQPKNQSGRKYIGAEKGFLLVLWYLSNQESFRQVSDRFDVTLSSAYRCLRRVLNFLLSIRMRVIYWPTEEEKVEIREGFRRKRGINHIVGAIDGSHIEIPKPAFNQHAYINRKGYHSLLLQGIVDHRKKFIDVFCGEPGSIHDARLLRKSGIYARILNNRDVIGEDFLIGDTAYPNLPWLVTPFKNNGHLTRNQNLFNYRLSASRIVIEQAFGLLKCRFRRLRKLDNINKELCSKVIMGACVLHNICIDANDLIDADGHDFNQPDNIPYVQHLDIPYVEEMNRRQQLFNEMFNER